MADYYPTGSRFGDFEANVRQGIVGGIPDRATGAVVEAATYGFATGASAATNAAAIISAVNASSQGDIIALPAGTFSLATVSLDRTHSNRTIRGAGMGSTILNTSGQYAFKIGTGGDFGSAFNPSSTITTLTADSEVIVVTSGALFPSPSGEANYRIGRIQLTNETSTPIISTGGFGSVRAIDVLMVSRSGNNITLSQPLPSAFTAGATGARFELGFQLDWHTRGIGIEDLTIDGNSSGGATTYGVFCDFATSCWVKGVKVLGHNNYAFWFADTVNCEIRKCWVDTGLGGGTNRSGVLWEHSSYGLVENNLLINNSPNIEVNFGSTSNVFAYNYHHTGIVNTNHGPHNSFNLYEGNAYWYAQGDGYFGGSSEETHFRNWMRSGVTLSLKRFTRNTNIIGNVVGTPGNSYPTDYSENWGNPNIGNETSIGTAQPSTGSWWADYDSGAGDVRRWGLQLTTRSSDTDGIITLDNAAEGDDFETSLVNNAYSRMHGVFGMQFVLFGERSGNTWSVTTTGAGTTGGNLPALNTSADAIASVGGFYEKDLDVALTAERKENYYVDAGVAGIPAGESIGLDTLPASYFRSSKPTYFGSLSWPAYDPDSPPANTGAGEVAIPAGYFYTNGVWPDEAAVAAPSFSVAAGTYNNDQSVTITCATTGASIYYTTDGTEPDNTDTLYTGAVSITGTTTLKAVGYLDPDYSAVTTAVYTLKVAAPVFDPVANAYETNQNVSMTTTTTGAATIYYTIDNTTPDNTDIQYTGAVSIAETTTVRAIGIKSGYSDSDVTVGVYVIEIPEPVGGMAVAGTLTVTSVNLSG